MGQVTHALLTRPPLSHSTNQPEGIKVKCFVRLACVKHAASVHPEPGSNSRLKIFNCRSSRLLNTSFNPVRKTTSFSFPVLLFLVWYHLFSIWYPFWIFSFKESSGSLSIVQLSRFFFAVCLLLSATAILEYHQCFHLSTPFYNFFQFFSSFFRPLSLYTIYSVFNNSKAYISFFLLLNVLL